MAASTSSNRCTFFQCENCKLFFMSMEVFARHECISSEVSDVSGVNLSQERSENDIDHDITRQQEEAENCKWTEAASLLLLAEFKTRQERIDKGRLNKKKAFQEIAIILQEKNFHFTDAQWASSMKTLIRQYKTVKETSGKQRKIFKYEKELDLLFKESPNIKPEFVISSTESTDNINKQEDFDSDGSCGSDETVSKTDKRKMEQDKGTSKTTRKTQVSEVLRLMKVQAEEREKINQEKEKKRRKT